MQRADKDAPVSEFTVVYPKEPGHMAPRRKYPPSDRKYMLAPVTALTRFRPDTSGLNSRARDQTEYIRQGVQVGATGIFLPYLEKVEIIELESVCPIPNTPMWFMGMINNRGNLLPVFDLKLFMAMDDQPSRWLMVIVHGGKAAGLCIDTLPVIIENPQTVDVDRDGAHITLPQALRPHIVATYVHNGKLWMDVAYDKLFLELCARF